jgi:hypothetical protein
VVEFNKPGQSCSGRFHQPDCDLNPAWDML